MPNDMPADNIGMMPIEQLQQMLAQLLKDPNADTAMIEQIKKLIAVKQYGLGGGERGL